MKLEDILKQKKKMYIVGSKDDKISFDILIVFTAIEECRIEGYALRFCASANDGKVIYLSYITDFTIKWDACSHFCFYGEDTLLDDPTREESYYHICGIYSYSVMIDTYLALVQISKAYFTEKYQRENFESKYTDALLEVFNKENSIKEISDSDYTFYTYED